MDQVAPFINDLCNTHQLGGRVFRRSPVLWELYDISEWNEHQTEILKRKFPSITTHIASCRESLTGFKIVLEAHPHTHFTITVTTCLAMLSAIAALGGLVRQYVHYVVLGTSAVSSLLTT
jgi:hypothetical protein